MASGETGAAKNHHHQVRSGGTNLYFGQPRTNFMLLNNNKPPPNYTNNNSNNYFEIIPIDSSNVFNNNNNNTSSSSSSSNNGGGVGGGGGFNQVPFYINEGEQVNDGLAVLEILYNQQLDTPEFIDVNDLIPTVKSTTSSANQTTTPEFIDVNDLILTQNCQIVTKHDDDDDVIFVAEYKQQQQIQQQQQQQNLLLQQKAPTIITTENPPRRNPVRKARKSTKYLTQDLLYDGDLTILDSSTDEDEIITVDYDKGRGGASLPLKDYKKWPVSGLHERPEYNDMTKTLEKFDYTIRQIKSGVEKKKATPVSKSSLVKNSNSSKPKKKIVTSQRKQKKILEDNNNNNAQKEMVKVSDLQDLLLGTLKDVADYAKNCKTVANLLGRSLPNETTPDEEQPEMEKNDNMPESVKNALSLLKTQALLYKISCGGKEDDVFKEF